MSNFRLIDRDTGFLMPPSVDEWLPQRHLARFVVVTLPKMWRKVLVRAFAAIFYETHPDGEYQYCRKLCDYPRALSRRQASVQARSSSATPSDIDH